MTTFIGWEASTDPNIKSGIARFKIGTHEVKLNLQSFLDCQDINALIYHARLDAIKQTKNDILNRIQNIKEY
jgi:hypothetical protein